MAAGRQKKIICGMEGEIFVAHGRLPFPARGERFGLSVYALKA